MAQIQIRHARAAQAPKFTRKLIGNDAWTVCGRVVVKQMTRVDASKANCPECEERTHSNIVFEIVRA
jgi:hypothetical protein